MTEPNGDRAGSARRLAYPDPPLHDELILLRPWRVEDLEGIAEAVSDPAIRRWSHLPEPFDLEAVRGRFSTFPAELAAGLAVRMLIVDADDETVLRGAIAVLDIDAGKRSAKIGYWLAASARGRGLASRAVRLVSAWALGELGLDLLVALVDADNDASRRLLTRCGFHRQGRSETEPDVMVYVATSETVRGTS